MRTLKQVLKALLDSRLILDRAYYANTYYNNNKRRRSAAIDSAASRKGWRSRKRRMRLAR